jgi:hypothetical protein
VLVIPSEPKDAALSVELTFDSGSEGVIACLARRDGRLCSRRLADDVIVCTTAPFYK